MKFFSLLALVFSANLVFAQSVESDPANPVGSGGNPKKKDETVTVTTVAKESTQPRVFACNQSDLKVTFTPNSIDELENAIADLEYVSHGQWVKATGLEFKKLKKNKVANSATGEEWTQLLGQATDASKISLDFWLVKSNKKVFQGFKLFKVLVPHGSHAHSFTCKQLTETQVK